MYVVKDHCFKLLTYNIGYVNYLPVSSLLMLHVWQPLPYFTTTVRSQLERWHNYCAILCAATRPCLLEQTVDLAIILSHHKVLSPLSVSYNIIIVTKSDVHIQSRDSSLGDYDIECKLGTTRIYYLIVSTPSIQMYVLDLLTDCARLPHTSSIMCF